jgi:hypothetical protein
VKTTISNTVKIYYCCLDNQLNQNAFKTENAKREIFLETQYLLMMRAAGTTATSSKAAGGSPIDLPPKLA